MSRPETNCRSPAHDGPVRTTVGFELTVTDTRTGLSKVYVNPDETAATTVTDTEALAACPSG